MRKKKAGGQYRDRSPGGTAADVIADLDHFPYPFKDDVFTEVTAFHALEHLEDIVGVMEEIHRISAPGALVHVRSPHYSSPASFNDPTHRHFSGRSPSTTLRMSRCTTSTRKRHSSWYLAGFAFLPKLRDGDLSASLDRGRVVANRFPWFYEKTLAFIVTASEIEIRLRVRKS